MSKLRKSVMALAALVASSAVFVSCSDDKALPDNMLGASFIQRITAGGDYVDLGWTITPTDNVDGYLVQIYEGTRSNMGSSPVVSKTFGKKEATGTFTGLQPNTNYVVTTQCVPAQGSGFTDADVAYFEFWTAPLIQPTAVSAVVSQTGTKEVPVIGEDGKPEMVPDVDENGDPVYDEDGEPGMVPKTEEVPVYKADVTLTWSPGNLTVQNIAGLYIYVENEAEQQVYYALYNPSGWTTFPTSTSFTVQGVNPGEEIMIDLWGNPSNYSWYTTDSSPEGIMYYTIPEVAE